MIVQFNPHTANNPLGWRLPDLPARATARERQLAEKYTRISSIVVHDDNGEDCAVADATIAWFTVEQQAWRITPEYCDTREEASWYCWMLAKALAKLIDLEA